MSKKLSKYIPIFDHFDKTLIGLCAASGGISIISFVSIIGPTVGIASASFSLRLSLTRNIKKREIKTKSKIKLFMLARTKLNSIETLISQALIDLEISHAEYKTMINEKTITED